MFSETPNLDAPPPQSQLRPRPWSPQSNAPSSSSVAFRQLQAAHMYSNDAQNWSMQQRRDASDPSVETLDLADYQRTLRTRPTGDAYPPFPSASASLPHQSSLSFPALVPGESTDSVPSLVSRGPTVSSHATLSSVPPTSPGRRSRGFAMSPPLQPSSLGPSRSSPYIVDHAEYARDDEQDIDVSRFPRWSQAWYDKGRATTSRDGMDLDDGKDIYASLPPPPQSIFDPTYVPHMPPAPGQATRDVLPWSRDRDPPMYLPAVDPLTKEERMHMLEKEFAGNRHDHDDTHAGTRVGSVDAHGRLVTAGPRRRVAVKIMQVVLSAAACVPGIYAAVAIKPAHIPPPAGKPPTIALYIVSAITLLLLLYANVVRRCCVRDKAAKQGHPMAGAGMMVLPLNAGGKKKKAKRGKGIPGQDLQVNLIVDPAAFRFPDDNLSESGTDPEEQMPGGYASAHGHSRERMKRNRWRRRQGLTEGLAIEAKWRAARSWVRRVCVANGIGVVVWGALFVWAIVAGNGGKCPIGGFGGWCNAYNVSLASACLLAVFFVIGVIYGVQDLHASKESPRTRN